MTANTPQGRGSLMERMAPLQRSTPPTVGATQASIAQSTHGRTPTGNGMASSSTPKGRVNPLERAAALKRSATASLGPALRIATNTNCRIPTAHAKKSSNTLQGRDCSMERVATPKTSTPPTLGVTQSTVDHNTNQTIPTTNAKTSANTLQGRVTSMERVPAMNRSAPPTRGTTKTTNTPSADGLMGTANAKGTSNVLSLAVAGPSRTPSTARIAPRGSAPPSSTIRSTPTSMPGIAGPSTNRDVTTTTRIPTFSTPPAIRTNITPRSYRRSTRIPPTPPSSPVMNQVPPSEATATIRMPEVCTSEASRGTTPASDHNNGTPSGPRRSQRNVAAPVQNQTLGTASSEDSTRSEESDPPAEVAPNRPFDKKRMRKDLTGRELAALREREKMRKRQYRAQTHLQRPATQEGNGTSGSISMTWRPVIKLFEGMPIGESQQQLVRALSRLLPNYIPCYRHARSMTDVELARVHNELQSRAHGAIEPPPGVLQCELKYFVQELASDDFQRRSERMTALSRAMVASRGCGNAMGAGGVDRARALYTLREGRPPTIADVRAWKDRCVKAYKEGPSRTALELRLQDPGPLSTEDDDTTSDEDQSSSASKAGSSEGDSSDDGGDAHPKDHEDDPYWYHPFLGPAAFYRRYVFLYEKEPTEEELQAWLSSGRPRLPHGN